MWKTELGGSVHTVQHLYHWNDYDQRDRARAVAEDHPWWYDATSRGDQAAHDNMLPMPSLRQNITSSEAVVMIEATDALESCGLPGAAGFTTTEGGPNVTWELRKYQLILGYTTMPRSRALFRGPQRQARGRRLWRLAARDAPLFRQRLVECCHRTLAARVHAERRTAAWRAAKHQSGRRRLARSPSSTFFSTPHDAPDALEPVAVDVSCLSFS